jgi:hypothetical protein
LCALGASGTKDNKKQQVACAVILQHYSDSGHEFIKCTVTHDKTWVHHCTLDIKCTGWNGSILILHDQTSSKLRDLLAVTAMEFFDHKGNQIC